MNNLLQIKEEILDDFLSKKIIVSNSVIERLVNSITIDKNIKAINTKNSMYE